MCSEKVSQSASQGYAAEGGVFYTGKPYLASSGSYAFKYRSYNPELARWTSEDPIGFPDGANGNFYAPKPTSELDWQGLLVVVANSGTPGTAVNSGITMNGNWLKATTTQGNTINIFKMTSVVNQPANPPIPGVMHDFNQNCHGFVYLPGYWIDNGQVGTILADEWMVTDQDRATIAVYNGSSHSAIVASTSSAGIVLAVTGKNGYTGVVTTSVGGTGYGTNPVFYANLQIMSKKVHFMMRLKSKLSLITLLILISMTVARAKEDLVEVWYIEKDLTVQLSINEGNITMGITNRSDIPKNVSSSLLDREYLLSQALTVGFTNFQDPRSPVEEFRMTADGVIGINSEIFQTYVVTILPNETKRVTINILESLEAVNNKKLQKYLDTKGIDFKLYIRIRLVDMGVKSNNSIRYEMQGMTIGNENGSPSLEYTH